MAHLVVFVVDDPEECSGILEAWEAIGVTGVTILESSGLGRFRQAGLRDDIPIIPSLRDIFESKEVHHRTLLSVVDNQSKVDKMVKVAQSLIGDLDRGHTGFLFVVPVTQVYGLGKDPSGQENPDK